MALPDWKVSLGRLGGAVADAVRYYDRNMPDPDVIPVADGTAAVVSRRSPGALINEDGALVIPYGPNACVLAVADGMGGGRSGEEASRLALEALTMAVADGAEREEMLRTSILNGIERANKVVADLGVGAATTLAAVAIAEGEARPYHVGDSFVLVVGRGGKRKLQTTAHSPVGFGVESGLLDEVAAIHHEERHVVSNVVGMPAMRIEVGPALPLLPNDTVLLGTDGLSDNLHVEETLALARKGPLEEAARNLVDTARRRMDEPVEGMPSKPDDVTLILFRGGSTSANLRRPR